MALETITIVSTKKKVLTMAKAFPHIEEPSAVKWRAKIPFATLFEVVKLLASVPIHLAPSGWQFSFLSWEFVGCALIYVLMVPIYWMVITDVYPLFMAPAEDPAEYFNQQIYYELFATLMVPFIVTPLTTWLDAPRTAAYINRYTTFLDLHEKTARRQLHFKLKTKLLLTFSGVGVVCQSIAVQIVPPYLAFWKTPACTINIIALCAYLWYWICLTDCLSQAGEAIAKELERELQAEHCDSKKIFRYKQLWLELSHLTTDSSSHFYRTMTVPVLITFFLITLSVYGFFECLRDPVYATFYSFCIFFNAMPLFLICNNAYITMGKVRDPNVKILVTVRRSRVSASCWQEVSSFLKTIDESPPVISIGGYAILDRKFLHAAGATISTYLVVIFQFRMSLQENTKKPSDGTGYSTVSPFTSLQ